MKVFRFVQKFSKFSDKLNRAKNLAESKQIDSQQDFQNNQNLPTDLNAITRYTNDSIIYQNQPEQDTLNAREIDSSYYKSKTNEKLHFKISGEESQVAIIDIYPGEKVRSESNKVIYMTEGVEMETHSAGGVSSMFKRFLGGSSMFVTDYSYQEQQGFGRVAFAETFPSKIIPIRLDDYNGVINCKKGTYICGSPDVDINITFSKKFTAGFFGGEGFVLQSLTQQTPGQTVLLRAGGSIIKRQLRQGEKIKVSPGLVVAFDSNIQYNIELISMKSLANIFGGSRSLLWATFTGPGDLYLQSLSFENLIEEISDRMPRSGGGGLFGSSSSGSGSKDSDNTDENADVDDDEEE